MHKTTDGKCTDRNGGGTDSSGKVELGDTSAMYCVSKKGMAFLMWDNGEYMFHITATGFGRDELFRTAMSIKELSAD